MKKKRFLKLLALLTTTFAELSCDRAAKKTAQRLAAAEHYPVGSLKYDLNQPAEKYFLNDDLEEISGLSYYKPNQLACIQDEEGKVFIYDTNEKKIVNRLRFGKAGDYEGVEVVGDYAYVVRSEGTLFRFKLDGSRAVKAEEIKTPLSKKNDVEGLGYDPGKNQLLLACKGSPDIGKGSIRGKAIYAYDLTTGAFLESPVCLVDEESLSLAMADGTIGKIDGKKLAFNPSGIAVHPVDGTFYVIASDGKLLVVINRDGSIVESIHLDPRTFKQPEGICFAPNGDLYISSESRGSSGYILKFVSK